MEFYRDEYGRIVVALGYDKYQSLDKGSANRLRALFRWNKKAQKWVSRTSEPSRDEIKFIESLGYTEGGSIRLYGDETAAKKPAKQKHRGSAKATSKGSKVAKSKTAKPNGLIPKYHKKVSPAFKNRIEKAIRSVDGLSAWKTVSTRFYQAVKDPGTQKTGELKNGTIVLGKGAKLEKDAILHRINLAVSRLDFQPSKPLNLDTSGRSGTFGRKDTAKGQKRIVEIDRQMKENSRLMRKAEFQEKKKALEQVNLKLMEEKQRLERGIKTVLKTQQSLF